MNSTKVSIVVPVYNVEKYLEKCLDSLVSQTLRDIEIIIVNDGSTDGSALIAETFQAKDPRISIINKNNGGLSSARNSGILAARGEFIGFVDSDDFVDPGMFEILYKKAVKTKSEIVMCSVKTVDAVSLRDIHNNYYSLEKFAKEFGKNFFTLKELDYWAFALPIVAVNKIYSRALLINNDIDFVEGIRYEDMPFFYSALAASNRISFVRDSLYFYRINRSGSIINMDSGHYPDIFKVYTTIENILRTNKLDTTFKRLINEQFISGPTIRFLKLSFKKQNEYFSALKKYIISREYSPQDLAEMYWESASMYTAIRKATGPLSFKARLKVSSLKHQISGL